MPPCLQAHIGSPNVFFEGYAGPYPVRVVVRAPEVIPGLAEISVRVATNGVQRITALPVLWNTGRQGAPPPDEALPVRGETNLYSAQLWFMRGGAQSVEVEISGNAGPGRVIVPMNAVATRVLGMPRYLGAILAALGALLFLLLVSVVGAAVRESVLPLGEAPSRKRRWQARAVMLGAALVVGGLAWLGQRWWASEAAEYRNNRLYQSLETAANVREENDRRILHLELVDKRFSRTAPLVPDHGKLMHLFLMREPGLDVFAHLHPVKLNWRTFETVLPDLPAGEYRVYADVTYETGLADTLTTRVTIPPEAAPIVRSEQTAHDPDDSYRIADPISAATRPVLARARSALTGEYSMEWLGAGSLVVNQETRLRFAVRDAAGRAVHPEPYMGMLGHVVLRRQDGAVFTHLHPSGSFSMAAQQLFELRAENKAPLKVAPATGDPLCQLPSVAESQVAWLRANPADAEQAVAFPYAFPKPGKYRIWAQIKVRSAVLTGVFDAEVLLAR